MRNPSILLVELVCLMEWTTWTYIWILYLGHHPQLILPSNFENIFCSSESIFAGAWWHRMFISLEFWKQNSEWEILSGESSGPAGSTGQADFPQENVASYLLPLLTSILPRPAPGYPCQGPPHLWCLLAFPCLINQLSVQLHFVVPSLFPSHFLRMNLAPGGRSPVLFFSCSPTPQSLLGLLMWWRLTGLPWNNLPCWDSSGWHALLQMDWADNSDGKQDMVLSIGSVLLREAKFPGAT